MEEQHVSMTKTHDSSAVVASFFFGVAFTLLVLVFWLVIKNLTFLFVLSLITLVIFLAIAMLFARPRKIRKIVRITKLDANKEKEFVGSAETMVYHKKDCRFAKSIKPEFKVASDDKSVFDRYKKCNVCLKN